MGLELIRILGNYHWVKRPLKKNVWKNVRKTKKQLAVSLSLELIALYTQKKLPQPVGVKKPVPVWFFQVRLFKRFLNLFNAGGGAQSSSSVGRSQFLCYQTSA